MCGVVEIASVLLSFNLQLKPERGIMQERLAGTPHSTPHIVFKWLRNHVSAEPRRKKKTK